MNLYRISSEHQSLLNNSFCQETGEFDAAVMKQIEATEQDFNAQAVSIASMIKNMEAERDAIENARKTMQDREKALSKKIESIEHYLQSNMQSMSVDEVKCALFAIKLKKCPASVDITDEALIPDDYRVIKSVVSFDKVKIKTDLQNGTLIKGASIKHNVRLEIK